MTTERRCEWDGHRSINDLTLGGSIDRSSPRWILESVDDGGRSEKFIDARLDLGVTLFDDVVISIDCGDTFFAPGQPDNLIDTELWQLEAEVGHRFEPDAIADELIFEAEVVGLSCIVMDGRVSCVWLADFDLVDEDTPDAPRPVGAG